MNNKKSIPLFMKRDVVLIFVLLLAAFAVFFLFKGTDGTIAEISLNGETVKTINLKTATNGELNIGTAVIEIKNGEIRFKDSDCPDKVCVNTGFIKNSGQTAACVPNKIAITIKGINEEADIIAY